MRTVSIILLVLGVFLGGCALSPQMVTLTPLVDAAVPITGHNRTLALRVVDARPDAVLGLRGGVYPTATITANSPVDGSVRRALSERLSSVGFRIADGDHPRGLTVNIIRLSYQADPVGAGATLNDIRVQATLEAEAYNPNRRHTARYRHQRVQRAIGYPSAAANEALINQVLADGLRQLLQDGALLDVLAETG